MTNPQHPRTAREHYTHFAEDVARYGDTDRQGHINNAVFSSYLETGRTAMLFDPAEGWRVDGCAFVVARLELDFLAEMHWRGPVVIGSRIASIGRTSVRFAQGIFQDGRCTATAESVLVLMDDVTRRPTLVPDRWRQRATGLEL